MGRSSSDNNFANLAIIVLAAQCALMTLSWKVPRVTQIVKIKIRLNFATNWFDELGTLPKMHFGGANDRIN